MKEYKIKSGKEKGAWDKVQRQAGQASRSFLTVESHTTRLILPASSCGIMGEMLSTMKAHYRLSPNVFMGAGYIGILFLLVPKSQTFWRKVDVNKLYCLYKHFRPGVGNF